MAADDPKDDAAVARFFREGYRFDFFQAVKLVEGAVRFDRRVQGERDVSPVGSTADPDDEPLRFWQHVSLGFPASDLRSIEMKPRDGDTPKVEVTFMGLNGPRGPLPLAYAQLLKRRQLLGDHGIRAFYDIFNHRLVSMLYQVRQRHRPTLHTGRPEGHPFAGFLAAFGGVVGAAAGRTFTEDHRDADGVPRHNAAPRDLLYYAGLLWHRDRSMNGLERMLSHHFGVPIRGAELAGRWIRLAEDARTALSARHHNNRLGISAAAGSRVWDPQAGFELAIGPLPWADFCAFLPTGPNFVALVQLTRFYVRSAFDFHVRLSVKSEAVFTGRGGLSARPTVGPRLGWNSWLMSRPFAPGRAMTVRVPGRTQAEADAISARAAEARAAEAAAG
ncbi:MAG: type VI secretion system baseplate subunit TssG [Myxococcales bacterium]|nr:type VI secretion system baseplate subunit TssG [Myxococcales bacterium]